ncbi:cation:proton antiporter [Usitatibacter palustris]|uniref:Cation/proton antiporter YbaL n=1 Tax=Usitatibacter palustris TaxID=2732487 RepID=A0A6M4H9A2_9PROT|nr:cation:proton antiporter [Usitatibacter palustris]QJR15842.1 Putative cation/proton antiporter YbaL [Usitatibacter palustris]
MHDLSLIITLAGGLAVALVFGWITQRLGLSTLVGYMLAGIVVGPYTPGFVADGQFASQMAEIGVILLMFGVGMHFHPQELLRVWRVAVPGAVGQSIVAAVAGWFVARHFGWSHGAGLVFGMALAVASTVVLMRMLVERDRLGSQDGHVAVGWLIVEDLFTVVALVVLPALAGSAGAGTAASIGKEVALAIGAAGLFAALVWAIGARLFAPIMEKIALTRSTELFTLTVFVVALGVAVIAAEVFHVSVALGAFFGGLVVGQSRFGPQAAADMAPFRDVFSALFFVSVGMLFDPVKLIEHPGPAALALVIVLLVKPAIALAIVLVLRHPMRTALTVAVGLAQIGEFSFILGALGKSLGILPDMAIDALIFAAIASIAVNPVLFSAVERIEARRRHAEALAEDEAEAAPKANPAVVPIAIVGAGEMARTMAARFTAGDLPARQVSGELEGIEHARVVIVTTPTLAEKMRVCAAVRAANPRAMLIAMADSSAERAWLGEFGVDYVADTVGEMSEAMLRAVRRVL